MPMPTLDRSRYLDAVLADPDHKLPLPDRGGRLFLAAGETVDSWDPFYAHLLADGSLKLRPAEVAPAVEDGSTEHVDAAGTTTVLDHGSGILTSVDSSGVVVPPPPAVVAAVVAATTDAGITTPEVTLRKPEAAAPVAADAPTVPAAPSAEPAH